MTDIHVIIDSAQDVRLNMAFWALLILAQLANYHNRVFWFWFYVALAVAVLVALLAS